MFDDIPTTESLGAEPAGTAAGLLAAHKAASGEHPMSGVSGLPAALALLAPLLSPALTGTPTVPTAAPGTNTTQAASTAFVAAAIAAIINSSPAALDTLFELAAALGNDANFATTVTNALAAKLPLSLFQAAGDIPVGTGAGAAARLAKGGNGESPIVIAGSMVSGRHAAGRRLGSFIGPKISGRYIYPAFINGTLSVVAGVAGRLQLYPFTPDEDHVINELKIRVSTGVASATAKVGIYNSNANREPGTLFYGGTSNLDCSTSATVPAETLSPTKTLHGGELYYLATWHSSTAALWAIPALSMSPMLGSTNLNTNVPHFGTLDRSLAYGSAWPDPWVWNASEISTSAAYLVALKLA